MLIVIRVSLAEHWVLNAIRNLAASSYRENEVCTHHLSFKRLVKQKGVAVAIGSSNNSKVLPSHLVCPQEKHVRGGSGARAMKVKKPLHVLLYEKRTGKRNHMDSIRKVCKQAVSKAPLVAGLKKCSEKAPWGYSASPKHPKLEAKGVSSHSIPHTS